jgi:mRNA-degrading endonuclease RelE of RelBE toxin-antitoxin system
MSRQNWHERRRLVSYQIELEPSVHAELRRLPGYVRAQAITVIDQLGIDPRSTRAKELRDKPGIFRI